MLRIKTISKRFITIADKKSLSPSIYNNSSDAVVENKFFDLEYKQLDYSREQSICTVLDGMVEEDEFHWIAPKTKDNTEVLDFKWIENVHPKQRESDGSIKIDFCKTKRRLQEPLVLLERTHKCDKSD